MKISTKRGDKGMTGTLDGIRVSKGDIHIEFLGTLDELQAHIANAAKLAFDYRERICEELYEIMAGRTIDESWMDTNMNHNGKFMPMICSDLNVARTVCRRAERVAVRAEAEYSYKYLNRLSDLLYKLAVEEVI